MKSKKKTCRVKGYTYRRKIGRRWRKVHVKAYRRKIQKRRRSIQPLVGWETVYRWRSELQHDFRGLDLGDPLPALLRWVTPTEETYFLSHEKRYPPREGLYVILIVWIVVENTKTKKRFLWLRAKQLGTGLLAPEETNVGKARGFYEDAERTIEEGVDYLSVRKWAGWTVTSFKAHEKTGAWFRGKHGKKRRRGKATT